MVLSSQIPVDIAIDTNIENWMIGKVISVVLIMGHLCDEENDLNLQYWHSDLYILTGFAS